MDGEVSPASYRGSPDTPPNQEMAEGRRTRGWGMVGDGERYASRLGDFTAALQRLPALRLRSLGTALAYAPSRRRSDRGSICGRQCARVPISRGRGPIPPRMEGAAAEVRSGTPPE